MNGGASVTRVMIVEDHWVWARAVEAQLASAPEIEVVGVAANAHDGMEMARTTSPDVALIDLLLGEGECGLRVARAMRSRGSEAKIAIVTTQPSRWAVSQARDLGLQGFVSKHDLTRPEHIDQMVCDLAFGKRVISPSVRALDGGGPLPYGLTDREVEFIGCFAADLATPEIARRLCVSQQTVRNKTTLIGKRMGVSGRRRIAIKAANERILELEAPAF